jgi:hypothetical protein
MKLEAVGFGLSMPAEKVPLLRHPMSKEKGCCDVESVSQGLQGPSPAITHQAHIMLTVLISQSSKTLGTLGSSSLPCAQLE